MSARDPDDGNVTWPWIALVGAWAGLLLVLPWLGSQLGLGTQDGAFLDLHAILAAGEAHLRGWDVYRSNPLDLYGRPHSYSSWWLVLGEWGLRRGDVVWLGLLWVAAFLAAVVMTVRLGRGRHALVALLLIASPSIMLALVRANNDLVVFVVLAGLVPALVSSRPLVRLGAVLLVGIGTGLKYYPLAASVLLLVDVSPRLVVWRLVLGSFVAVLVLLGVYEDTLHLARTLPAPQDLFSFGAAAGLKEAGLPAAARAWVLAGVAAMAWRGGWGRTSSVPADPTELRFVLAAVLLAGCFWAGMNWAYRWIFAIWLLPWCREAGGADGLLSPRVRRLLPWLVVAACWWDGLCSLAWNLFHRPGHSLQAYSHACWLWVQPLHWIIFGALTIAVVRFTLRSLRTLGGSLRLS